MENILLKNNSVDSARQEDPCVFVWESSLLEQAITSAEGLLHGRGGSYDTRVRTDCEGGAPGTLKAEAGHLSMCGSTRQAQDFPIVNCANKAGACLSTRSPRGWSKHLEDTSHL